MENEMSNSRIQKDPHELFWATVNKQKKFAGKRTEGKMPGEEEEEEAIKSTEHGGKMPGD
jgi:hypothetical protein